LLRNGVFLETISGTTGSDGEASFPYQNIAIGFYSVTVTNVISNNWVWDGVDPVDDGFNK